jgi:hypothetical protein
MSSVSFLLRRFLWNKKYATVKLTAKRVADEIDRVHLQRIEKVPHHPSIVPHRGHP